MDVSSSSEVICFPEEYRGIDLIDQTPKILDSSYTTAILNDFAQLRAEIVQFQATG